MSTISSLCQEFIKGHSEQNVPKTLAGGIVAGTMDLVSVVEALGIYLTSKDIDNRAQGTRLLSELLSHLQHHVLSKDEVQYLVVFYCDRLKDSALITPYVLHGLMALVTNQQLFDEDVVIIVRALFRELHIQSQPQSSRKIIYSLLYMFLTDYIKALNIIGSEFVLGYIQAMDGEKDPRNLLIIFSSIPLITRHLDFTVLIEDLFEVLSCYFPIDFNPSPKDPDPISKEELVIGLRNSLTSTPKFSEFCIPLLLEKLSSDVHGSKLDSLHTLVVGAATFGNDGLRSFITSIWQAIKQEVFYPVADNIEIASLQALKCIVEAVTCDSPMETSNPDDLQELIELIIKDCCHHICQPELKMIHPATRLLQATAGGSLEASSLVAKDVIPLLIQQFNEEVQVSTKIVLLEILVKFLKVFGKFKDIDTNRVPFASYLQPLFSFLLPLITEENMYLCTATISTLSSVIYTQCLSLDEVGQCAGSLMKLAINCKEKSIRDECTISLSIISKYYPQVIQKHVLPTLTTQLQYSGTFITGSINILTAVSINHDVIMMSLPILINFWDSIVKVPCSEENLSLALVVSEAIEMIFGSVSSNQVAIQIYHDDIIPRILKICINQSIRDLESHGVLFSEGVLLHLAAAIRIHTQCLDLIQSQEWIEQIMNIFMRDKLDDFISQPADVKFLPLQTSSPWQQTQLVVFLTAVLSSIKVIKDAVFSDLFPNLIRFCLESSSTFACHQGAKGCGCLVNKMADSGCGLLEQEMENVWNLITNTSSVCERRKNALSLWLWITKGLIVRSHPIGVTAVNKLLTLFVDEFLGCSVADGFHHLLCDFPDCLNSVCNANIKIFHKQRLFSIVVPQLVSLYQSEESIRQYCIETLSYIMQAVPKQVLLADLPNLLPLLLESLNSSSLDQHGVLISSLDALHSLVNDAPVIISEHLSSLVPRLLQISQTNPYMKVRISSLKCLSVLTILPSHLIYPHQNHVIRELALCLDDKKRLVRKEAVSCRNEWNEY